MIGVEQYVAMKLKEVSDRIIRKILRKCTGDVEFELLLTYDGMLKRVMLDMPSIDSSGEHLAT